MGFQWSHQRQQRRKFDSSASIEGFYLLGDSIRKNIFQIILMIVVVLMGAEILYLIVQNRRLVRLLEAASHSFETLSEGATVRSLDARDINGIDVNLNYGESEPRTLLMWFSPTCASCEANQEFWNELYRDNKSEDLCFLGICACDPEEATWAASEYDLQFTIMSTSDPSTIEDYKGNVLPQTILISPQGKVQRVWPGSLTTEQKDEILTALAGI